MKTKNVISFTIAILILVFSLGVKKSFSQVTDCDGNSYKTVKIGNQEWMAENLNVSHYRNGDVIPQVTNKEEWSKLTTGAWCYYENITENGKIYGKLYNWFAVNDPRGLAPEGWHIPSDAEWTELTEYLGVKEEKKTVQGIDYWKIADVGGKLKARALWNSPNEGATNSSGFSAFPGGFRNDRGSFNYVGVVGIFWSASENINNTAWIRDLLYGDSDVTRFYDDKKSGFSIRCVRD